ncbi:uncharacterized protein LOC113370670 [Ctenocephalides felis]|uniref:uncharacterized protein LOC113370670 n=1 Tax=Ctenocephalides felis TaxID=7515 RepID=UPI000E6E5066|nr:uncharacterized protein LOC113370670 [Ctenocephalides felis]
MSRSGGMSRASSIPTLTASINSQSRIPVPVRHHSTSDPPGRNASGSTTPTSSLRRGETTPGGSQRNVSLFETTVTTTRSSGQTPSSGTTNGRRRPIPMDQRAPFR